MFVHTVIMVIEPHMKQGRQHKLISTIFLATSVTKKLDHNTFFTFVHRVSSSSRLRTCGRKTMCSLPQYRFRSSRFFFKLAVCMTSVSNTRTTVVHKDLRHSKYTYCSSIHPISSSSRSESWGNEANTSFSTAFRIESVLRFNTSEAETADIL